ncbi:MAG: TetR/AcrR family transcriptional regulator [Proteobacteria bacterium]|nr:TetR/AcrR family transcriptional regulator [Pseudomonadota bacterium]HQR02974.1 helix-turn-helix domain-containing protein [Rhodocyclaceae bacterium]
MTSALAQDSGNRVTARSIATRAKLLAVAERLFATQGVDGTTLNEIGQAADQRNAAACQYHFGNKDGLLQAILDKHTPGIAARRNAILDEIERTGPVTLRDAVHAYVTPVAEKLRDTNGGPEYIRINAQLLALHAMYYQHLGPSTLRPPQATRMVETFGQCLSGAGLPPPVQEQRLTLSSIMLFHGLADHSRIVQMSEQSGPSNDTALFVAILEDAITAMLTTPVSADTLALLPMANR